MILTITVRSSLHVSAPPHSDSTAPRAPPGLSAPQAGATLLSTMAGPFGEPLTALRPIRFGSKVAVRGRVHRVCWPVPPCAAGQGVGRLRDRAGRCTVQRCALRRRGRRVLRHLAGWHAAPRETQGNTFGCEHQNICSTQLLWCHNVTLGTARNFAPQSVTLAGPVLNHALQVGRLPLRPESSGKEEAM